MIEYILRNTKGEHFSLNTKAIHVDFKKSWTQGSDSFEIDAKIVERSFLPGSVVVGALRTKAREIELRFEYVHTDAAEYRKYMNKLMEFFYDTRYLIDHTNDLRLEVVPQKVDISYGDGSLKHHSENTFSFLAISPHWESRTETMVKVEAPKVLAGTTFTGEADITGHVPVLPRIAVDFNIGGLTYVHLTVEETGHNLGFNVQQGFRTFIVDCAEGVLQIDDMPNRNDLIEGGGGFFTLPPGKQKIIAKSKVDNDTKGKEGAVKYSVAWRELFWL